MSGLPSSAAGTPEVEDGSLHSVPLLCRTIGRGPALDAAVTWLAAGGAGDRAEIRALCESGEVIALVDVAAEVDDPPAAAAVVVPHAEGEVELCILFAPGPQEADLTRHLLAEVCDALRRGEVTRLVVAAANRRVPPVELLEDAGFRVSAADPDVDWFDLRL